MRFYTLLNHTYFILTWSLLVTGEDGWTLLWSDEFDQDGFLNSSVWTPRTGFLGYNGEFQTYTDSPENLRVEGGKLHITALKSSQGYTSARINTMNKLKTKYSMIEASIKIPPMQIGLWPAMWTLGDSYSQGVPWPASGEIDIMELGQKLGSSMGLGNRRVVSAWHWQAFNDYAIQDRYLDVEYPLNESFHTYKLIWQPDYMSTYVDDQLIGTISLAACETSWDCPEFHQHHFLILNLAVGGEFTCCEYGFALENEPHGTTWTMEVDYVRIYGNEHTDLVAPTSAEQNAEETPTFTLVEPPMPTSLPTTLSPTSIPSDLLSEKPTLNPTLSVEAPTSGPTPDVQMDTEPRTSSPVAAPSNAEVPSNEPTLDVASFLNAVDGDSNATSNSPTFDAGTPTISSPTQQPQLSEIVAAEDDGRSSLPDYLKEEESGSVSAWSLLRLLGISTACLLVVYLLLQAS